MDCEVGHLTKEAFMDAILFMKYRLPQIEWERLQFEREMRRQNPFWPFKMTPELLEMLKKWSQDL